MALFNTWGVREQRLSAAALRVSAATDALLGQLLAPLLASNSVGAAAGVSGCGGDLLRAFDAAWAEYLALFAAWKGHDAAALEVRHQTLTPKPKP